MNSIKQIRNQVGINQQDLADYLGVVRSAVALAETNRQQLPTNALLKLDELYFQIPIDFTALSIPLTATEIADQEAKLQFFLQERQNINEQKIKQLERQLKLLQTNYSKALKLLQAVRTLQQKTSNTAKNKKDILWLAAMEALAMEKININGLVAQQRIQTLINTLNIV